MQFRVVVVCGLGLFGSTEEATDAEASFDSCKAVTILIEMGEPSSVERSRDELKAKA